MTPYEMLKALALAADKCSEIHYYACHDMDKELQGLMSAIDTCLHEAMDLIQERENARTD